VTTAAADTQVKVNVTLGSRSYKAGAAPTGQAAANLLKQALAGNKYFRV
jgi:hypothetical protein